MITLALIYISCIIVIALIGLFFKLLRVAIRLILAFSLVFLAIALIAGL